MTNRRAGLSLGLRASRSAVQLLRFPSVFLPVAVGTIAFTELSRLLRTGQNLLTLPSGSKWMLAGALYGRFWLGLVGAATALAILRAGTRWRPTVWVGPMKAAEAAWVVIVSWLPILLGSLLVLINLPKLLRWTMLMPALALGIRWSQVPLVIVDGRAKWFEALEPTYDLSYGRRTQLLIAWAIVATTYAAAWWLQQVANDAIHDVGFPTIGARIVGLLFMSLADAFLVCSTAALFYELSRD